MKKRGATIKHKAASMPGALALSICPEYETRLRLAVNALSDGWMEESQFNDLADTIDMLQIGMASYSKQKPDPSTAVAVDVCREAMMSIRGRYIQTGKFGATGEELKAIHLLADVSLDFWRRRSGALFAFSVQQLKELRADRRDEAKQLKEETEAMNARDNAPTLPAIDGAINAAHGLLLKSGDALSADDVAKALAIKKAEASKQLRELNGLGLLESEPRKGGTMFFRLAVVAPAKVCDLVQTEGESQTESGTTIDWQAPEMQYLAPEDYVMPPADLELLASANRILSDRLEGVAHVLRGCGLPSLTEISDQEDLQMAAAALSGAYQMALADAAAVPDLRNITAELEATVALQREMLVEAAADVSRLSNELATERRVSGSAISAVASICEHLGCDDHNGHVPVLRAIDDLRAQIASLTADVMRTRGCLHMGNLTDDELANGAFLNYDQPLNVAGILAGTHQSPIAWMTAVKDRIRWLSRSLEKAVAERDALTAELEAQYPSEHPTKFFCYSEDIGYQEFGTLDGAITCAESMLSDARDNANFAGEWSEEETSISYGSVIGEAVEIVRGDGGYEYSISRPGNQPPEAGD